MTFDPLVFDNPEESARAFGIITEEDPFRLVIRGHAMVEEVVDGAIDAAFADGTPDELKRLNLPARLALAEALELLTTEVVAAVKALAKVRNRLAHGGDDVVTSDERRALRVAFEPLIGADDVDLDDWSEIDQLRIIVSGTWAVNDYVECFVQQNSGSALNLVASGNFSPEFSMVRVV
jgi:hypothetical protein